MSERPHAPAPADVPVLRAEALERVFIDGKRTLNVLRGVSLELKASQIVAIKGRSGSGKSTLLHILGLLDKPDGGDLFLNGDSVLGTSEKRRAQHRANSLGFVFQQCFLMNDFNVLDNLLMATRVSQRPAHRWFAGKREARKKATELLEKVGMPDQASQYPLTLSGGERQRVALARALMPSPQVLLCDEPTGNLDPDTGARIMRLVHDLCRNESVAALIVTHDPNLAASADRVLTLKAGKLHVGD